MIVNAEQARGISTLAMMRQRVRSELAQIEKAAGDGRFEWSFGSLDREIISALEALGFKTATNGPNTRVSWGAT